MNIRWIWLTFLSMSISMAFGQHKSKTLLFIGSYTDGKPGRGIYVYTFNPKLGAVKEICAIDNITNPSYLTLSPNGQYLYACTDTKLPERGSVAAFKINRTKGTLTFINREESGGDNPVYLSVHTNGKWLINANYTPLSNTDGR